MEDQKKGTPLSPLQTTPRQDFPWVSGLWQLLQWYGMQYEGVGLQWESGIAPNQTEAHCKESPLPHTLIYIVACLSQLTQAHEYLFSKTTSN